MSLIPSRKHNSCPICENTSGKCRQSREDADYWQCMTYADAKKGEVISGYKCLGHSKNGLWGQFRVDNSQEWSEQQRLEWKQRNQQRQQEIVKDEEQRRQKSLKAENRHAQYTSLLSELSLHSEDREDLIRRGFTSEQIELSGFKSVEAYQPLQRQYSELLPGIGTGGRSLIVGNAGYLIPVRNADGLIVACQIRLRSLPVGQNDRYRWLSSKKASAHVYTTGFNPKGEMPLAIHRPKSKPTGLALVEGTGAKPFLASQRLNLLVIGASGGLFTSSESILKSCLERLSEELGGARELTIYPDKGSVIDIGVMSRWRKTIDLLEKWNWFVKVAWWGQADKSSRDIDELDIEELTDHNTIEFIAPQEFLKLAPTKPTEQKKGFSDYKEKAKEAWQRAKRFTADIITASQWCDWKLPPSNSIFFGRAGLGRGKTTRLRNWVRILQEEGKGFICLGYRNTLLLQLCEKLGFYHLHEAATAIMRHDPSGGIALCMDSLWKFRPEEFDGKVLILDEVMSVIRHLLHSPTVKGRDNILELFQEALQRASQVICLDGCMADWAVQYLHEFAPGKKIIRAENTFSGEKPTVNFLLGTIDIEEEVRKNDRSPWLEYLLNDCAVPAACSDSQVFIESLDNLLTEKGLKTLRVDSKTVPEEYVKEFLKDCNAYIEKHQPDVILYTPSAESGVDVSISDYFTGHVGFFFGVLGVDSILQMLGRIRDAKCTKFVWVREWVAQSEQTHSRSPFIKKVGQAIEKMLCQDITDTISGIDRDQDIVSKLLAIIQNSKNPHFKASNQIQAIDNYEKSNLRECVLESLKASGYSIRMCTLSPSEKAREKVKEATEATKRQNSHDIFTAEKIAPELADELSKKFDARWEERVKVIQASYRSRLPGIDETSSWSEEFIYKIRYDNPDFLSQQELFWLFSHPEEANRMNQERYYRLAQKERIFIGNIRSRMARVRALRAIGFEKFLDPEKVWMEESPELVELVEQCRDEKIAVALGRHPGKQSNIRFLGSLLKIIGLKHKGQKVRSEDGDYRIYQLDRDTLSDPDRRHALQCLDRRWENYLNKEVEVLNWEPVLTPPTESQLAETNENPTCQQDWVGSQEAKSAQSQSGQGFNPVPRKPTQYIYTNEASWNQSDRVESHEQRESTEGVAVEEPTPLEAAIQVLTSCESVEGLRAIVLSYGLEVTDDAIAMQDTQPRRSQLRKLLEAVSAGGEIKGTVPSLPEPEPCQMSVGDSVRVRSRLLGDRVSLALGLKGIVEQIALLGRCLVRFPELGDRLEPFDACELESICGVP